ncbi:MAG TPA: DUF1905 domain-containing protein [Jiangellales bacterium]|nr:DUF1905 domain-containing protein [Jiangellales bacterium]
MSATYTFEAVLWEHDGPAAWHFVTLPAEYADEIAAAQEGRATGFGSVRVEAAIGGTRWATSLFPDTGRGSYVLPVKKAVRTAENLGAGSTAKVTLVVPAPEPGG